MNRIFVSYRSSDGKKDAHRLAADLSEVFGADSVFFDKQDLHGGTSWRDEIGSAMHQRPILVLLVTPELVGATLPDGRRRIDLPDDPVRMEITTALTSGARLLPILSETTTMPGAADLPAELHPVTERHALRLRTEDWAYDLGRIVEDLTRLGVEPVAPATQDLAPPSRPSWPYWVTGGLAAAAVLAFVVFGRSHAPAPTTTVTPGSADSGPSAARANAQASASQSNVAPPFSPFGRDETGSAAPPVELPAEWPSDIPTYPGAAIQMAGSMPEGGTNLMSTTTDGRQQVLEFYERRLTGWKQLYAANIQGGVARTYQDAKGSRVLSVTVMVPNENGPTQIMLMHMRQK